MGTQDAYSKVLAPPCLRRRLRCRESAFGVADTSWSGRSELARLNPTLTQVSPCCHIDTRVSYVSVGYRHGGRHLLSLRPGRLLTWAHLQPDYLAQRNGLAQRLEGNYHLSAALFIGLDSNLFFSIWMARCSSCCRLRLDADLCARLWRTLDAARP